MLVADTFWHFALAISFSGVGCFLGHTCTLIQSTAQSWLLFAVEGLNQ
jgi:hypothetical protein